MRRVEEALIAVCADLGVDHRPGARAAAASGSRADDRGPERKIAALGIRVSRGVTMHGFALNCDVDLGWYDRFVPVRHRRRRRHLADRRARPRRHRRRGAAPSSSGTCADLLAWAPYDADAGLPGQARARAARRADHARRSDAAPGVVAAGRAVRGWRARLERMPGSVSDLVIETTGLRKEFRTRRGAPGRRRRRPRPGGARRRRARLPRPQRLGQDHHDPDAARAGPRPRRGTMRLFGEPVPRRLPAGDRPGRRRRRAAQVRPDVHRPPEPHPARPHRSACPRRAVDAALEQVGLDRPRAATATRPTRSA